MSDEEKWPLTVADLRDLLAPFDDDVLVVLSSDAEGNRFSPLAGWGFERYDDAESLSWEVDLLDDEEDPPGDGAPCLVLWPTN